MGALAICQPTKARVPRARLYGLPTIDDTTLKERTIQQNRALWGCAYAALRRETGNDIEALHEYFCGSYWGWDESDGERHPKRTTTQGYAGERDVISTRELGEFYAFIVRRAGENGYIVPDPDTALRRTCPTP